MFKRLAKKVTGSSSSASQRSGQSSTSSTNSTHSSRSSQLLQDSSGLESRSSRYSSADTGTDSRRSSRSSRLAQQSRDFYTVVDPTRMRDTGDGSVRITNPGHIEVQASDWERQQYGIGPVLGHGPDPRATDRQTFPVQATLNDGRSFSVIGTRSSARPAGEDRVYDRNKPGMIVYDHGDMDARQAERWRGMEPHPVFPDYETSGHDRQNCVFGYGEIVNNVAHWPVDHIPSHTTPQEMADMFSHLSVRDYASDSDSDR